MRPRRLTVNDVAFAYELRNEYGLPYKTIAHELGAGRSVLNLAVLRCEREGIGWMLANVTRRRK